MPATKDSFAQAVEGLVRKFEADRDTYLSPGYNESAARLQFINPFFNALGWDVENAAGAPYHLCDVWVEESSETAGRPDYTFRVNGQTKFFVEAKAPSADLDNVGHILQTKRYAWSSRDIHFAGLTDFEEFRFFDASLVPDERRPLDGQAFHLQYTEYLKSLDVLWELSRERVAANSLEQFLRRDRQSIRNRIPPDKRFLDDLTEWRQDLARNIYAHNPGLDSRMLNEIVQRLLDRIVFIRIAEDRKVFEPGQLRQAIEWWEEHGGRRSIMEPLVELFQEINRDFNGEIFKSHPCEGVKLESAVLAAIIRKLYPPKSPYRFDVIDVELLGSIYERYLGNTLRVTPKQVRIEPKPEVRKAGGVYYTPKFIVDYIVKNTVGKLLEGKTPKEAQKLKILDPACGSGSFLIGAYQYLLDWHLNYYREHLKEARAHPMLPEIEKDARGEWKLALRTKVQILSRCLHGIDLDPQAVEITMMSLYLKALEGEFMLVGPKHERLPELKYNIRCGNSLIGPDIEKETPLSEEERERIRPFDWHSRTDGFGDILAQGGFDAVIGNPPWLMAGYHLNQEIEYLRTRFKSATGKFDMYYVFVERALALISPKGLFGMIVPNKFFHTAAATELRRLLSDGRALRHVVDFGDEQIFADATNYSCIVIVGKEPNKDIRFTRARSGLVTIESFDVGSTSLDRAPWHFERHDIAKIFRKIEKAGTQLSEIVLRFGTGVQSGADRILTVSPREAETMHLESEMLKPLLRGRDVRRYWVSPGPKFLIFPYKIENGEFAILSDTALRKYKRISGLLLRNRSSLAKRIWFGKTASELSGKWYGMMYLDSPASFAAPHLLTPSLSDRSNFALGTGDLFATGTAGVTSVIPKASVKEKSFYLLGILNSSLMNFYAVGHSPVFSGGYYKFSAPYLKRLPIRLIDWTNRDEVSDHDGIVRLVERMLELHKKKREGKLTERELERIEREIAATDAEIDELVYELYGITAEERKVIEEATAGKT
jgi:type I restriction-modification system DNA methylase subunit